MIECVSELFLLTDQTAINQVEPSTRLFPAVFAKANSSNVFQFELGRVKVT